MAPVAGGAAPDAAVAAAPSTFDTRCLDEVAIPGAYTNPCQKQRARELEFPNVGAVTIEQGDVGPGTTGAALWNGPLTCDGGGCWTWGLSLANLFWIQAILALATLLPLVPFMYELPIRGGAGVGIDLGAMWRETFEFLEQDGVF